MDRQEGSHTLSLSRRNSRPAGGPGSGALSLLSIYLATEAGAAGHGRRNDGDAGYSLERRENEGPGWGGGRTMGQRRRESEAAGAVPSASSGESAEPRGAEAAGGGRARFGCLCGRGVVAD